MLRRNTTWYLHSMSLLLVTASIVPSPTIFVTLMKVGLSSSETSVLTRAAWHNIPEEAILLSHCRENLKSYIEKNMLSLPGIEQQPSSLWPITIPTELSWLILSLEGKDLNAVSDGKSRYLREIQDWPIVAA
jgi:hypothetical protein